MWTAIAIIAVILLYFVAVYNGLVSRRNQVREAWATIDTQLKRRYDLIPNLMETVSGAAKHEKETLSKVIEARNAAMTSTNAEERIKNENALTGTLRSVFALSEAYPELKADTHFNELIGQLKNIEDEIASSRKYYNGNVKQFNTKIEVFPSSIIANLKKFEKKPLYEIDNIEERKNIKVEF